MGEFALCLPPSDRMTGPIKYTKDYHIFEAEDLHSQY